MTVSASIDAAARHPWVKPLARAGFAARGVVYLIIGAFAVMAAFGRSQVTGTKGALATILSQPFGQVLLWLAIIGLIGFAIWRLVQAWLDTDGHGSGAKGLAIRTGFVVSALIHAGLAVFAAGMVLGSGSGGGGDPTGRWIAAVYQAGYGQWLTWAVALIVAVVGCAQILQGYKAKFMPFFSHCPGQVLRWVRPLGRFGFIARGVTFLIIAALIFYGGLNYGGAEGSTPGFADALRAVQGYAFGWLVLLVIALGLVAFGLFSLAAARYRRVSLS